MRQRKRNMRMRSRLEEKVSVTLTALFGARKVKYEKETLEYTQPEKIRKYTPDFKVGKIYFEVKGIWDLEDRQKMLLIKEQYPNRKFVMVFWDAEYKIYPSSSTTYSMWCDQHNIPWVCTKRGRDLTVIEDYINDN